VVTAVRRIVFFVMGTVTVLILLFGYHTSTSSRAVASGEYSATAPQVSSSATAAPTPTSAAGLGGGATDQITVPSSGSGTSADSGETSSAAAPTTASPASSASPESSTAVAATSTVTGDVASTRWGPVQVELTIADGKITDAQVTQYPNGNGRDQQINSYALPILVQETIQAQSAQIDMVSGATVTSEGYLTSLQSALDQAGL
jgi:uncharacterized protein with FMN-binding domain